MQEFWIRLVSLFIVVSSLWGYNMTIDKREQENKNTQHIAAETESTDSQGAYKDGTYTGSAEGFGGNVDVKVTIEAGKISSVDITAAEKEDGAYRDGRGYHTVHYFGTVCGCGHGKRCDIQLNCNKKCH